MNFTTDWKFPSATAQDDSIGDTAWTFEDEIFADDSNYVGDASARSQIFVSGGDDIRYRKVSLVIAGAVDDSNNEAANESLYVGGDPPTPEEYGGASDLWGATLTADDVNLATFGVAVALSSYDGAYGDEGYYLLAMGFDFGVPDGATIVGIEAKFDGYKYAGGGGTVGGAINYVQMRVHYTWDPVINGAGVASGIIYLNPLHARPLQKRFRYRVFEHGGDYIGDWNDVSSEPKFKREINNLLSSMDVEFARTERTGATTFEPLVTEGDEQILTEDDETILTEQTSTIGIGTGTDLDINHDVEVYSYFGRYNVLTTEDDEPITTEDDELIVVETGAPHGRALFTGYVSKWGAQFGTGDENPKLTILSHSHELAHILLETEDTAVQSHTAVTGESIGLSGSGPTDRTGIAQTFTMSGTALISRIAVKASRWLGDVETTLILRTGTTIGAGTVLGTATLEHDIGFAEQSYIFLDYIELTAASYHFEIVYSGTPKTGGNETYPAQFAYDSDGGYSGGALYQEINGGSWNSTSADLWFKVYEAGGDTNVPFNSVDPSDIAKTVIDFARARGARINYTPSSIQPTNTVVSITFKANTCLEALNKIPELVPADWYQTYNPGDNVYSLVERPADPEQYFTLGRHMNSMYIERTLEKLVNTVLFSGGDTGGGENLLVKRVNSTSISDWRRGLAKVSDNRVTDELTANLFGDAEIDRNKVPPYSGNMGIFDVVDDDEYIEDIVLGVQGGYIGFGNFIDDLALQFVSLSYSPDLLTVDLETLPPKLLKRIQDIKRNLDLQEQENNPDAPA